MNLRTRFVNNPDSEAIAAGLNVERALACIHGRNPCYIVCGVRRPLRAVEARVTLGVSGIVWRDDVNEVLGPWEVIPLARRLDWLAGVAALLEARSPPGGPR